MKLNSTELETMPYAIYNSHFQKIYFLRSHWSITFTDDSSFLDAMTAYMCGR